MILAKDIEQYNSEYLYFTNATKNSVMKNGNFIKILYFTPLFRLNGIYLKINIANYLNTESYRNDYIFNPFLHQELIEKIKNIEIDILQKMNILNKVPEYNLHSRLMSGNIKIFTELLEDKFDNFIVKISGIWENEHKYGLNYKFIRK